jgi:hypothetical protein
MSKITKATFKSFVRKNEGKLLIRVDGQFDGMTDCVQPNADARFVKAVVADRFHENNVGVQGVWLVGGSGNFFRDYETATHKGIEVYNCCGSSVVAVAK